MAEDFIDFEGRDWGRILSVVDADGFDVVKVDPFPPRFLTVRDDRVLGDFGDFDTAYLVGRLALEGLLVETGDLVEEVRRHTLAKLRAGEPLSDAERRWIGGRR